MTTDVALIVILVAAFVAAMFLAAAEREQAFRGRGSSSYFAGGRSILMTTWPGFFA